MTPGQAPPSVASQVACGVSAPVVSVLIATAVQTFTMDDKLNLCKKRLAACTDRAALIRKSAKTLDNTSSVQKECVQPASF